MLPTILLAKVFLLSSFSSVDDQSDRVTQELKKLEGTWTITKLIVDGQQLPINSKDKDQLLISGDQMTMKTGSKTTSEATFVIDPKRKRLIPPKKQVN